MSKKYPSEYVRLAGNAELVVIGMTLHIQNETHDFPGDVIDVIHYKADNDEMVYEEN